MSASIVTLISWAPFLVFALVFGIIFAVKGYKRGSARAGVSVAVTAIACVISIIISKPIAKSLAGLVSPLIGEFFPSSGMTIAEATVIRELTLGIASAVCAVLIYTPIFVIFISVLKPLVSHIVKRFLKDPEKKANKIGGLAVSIVDALLISLLLTLPLYGTLSLVGGIAELSDGEDKAIELVSAAADPFVVDIVSLPPFSTAYDSLMTFKVSNTKISISGTVRGATSVASSIKLLKNENDGRLDREIAVKLINETESFFVKNEFITDLLCGYVTGNDVSFKIDNVPNGDIKLSEYYPALADGKLLREDLSAFFNLAEAMVTSGMIDALVYENVDLSGVDAEMISEEFGNTVNHSNSLVFLKSKLINMIIGAISEDIGENAVVDEAITAIKDAISTISAAPLKAEEAKKEGEAFYLLISGMIASQDEKNAIKGLGFFVEGLARHPMIGIDKVVNAMDVLLSGYSIKVTDELVNKLRENLRISVQKNVGQSTFSKYCDVTIKTFSAILEIKDGDKNSESNDSNGDIETITGDSLKEYFEELFVTDKEVLEAVKDTVSVEIMNNLGVSNKQSKIFKNVFDAVFEVIIDEDYTSKEVEKEAEALENILTVVGSVSQKSQDADKIIKTHAENMIDQCLESKTVKNMLINIEEDGKSDPLGIFTNLTSKTKDSVNKTIDSYISKMSDKSDIDVLNALKLFIGVQK